MPTFDDLQDEVFEAVKTYLGDGASGAWTYCPIAYPNDAYEPIAQTPFVDVEFTGDIYGQVSVGAATQATNRWDESGRLWLHVMVPSKSGSSSARGAAKALAVLFRGLTLIGDGLEFLDASIGSGEPGDEDGQWFRVSVNIRWRRIES